MTNYEIKIAFEQWCVENNRKESDGQALNQFFAERVTDELKRIKAQEKPQTV